MAKRGASTDLNHDNWDEEEATEEAGEFKKASDEEMKGRVVKKARRKLKDEGRKNVFAGFGGFSSSNPSATEAFSFLKNQSEKKKEETTVLSKCSNFSAADETVDNTGEINEEKREVLKVEELSESNTKDNQIKPVFGDSGGFTFGSAPSSTPFSGFSFSSATSSTKTKVESSGTPIVGSFQTNETSSTSSVKGSIFGSGTAKVGDTESKAENSESTPAPAESTTSTAPSDVTPAAPPVDDLMAKFCKPKDSDSWICEVCMISNPNDRDTCLACESPRPGSAVSNEKKEAPQAFTFGSGGGFKFVDSNNSSNETKKSSLNGFKSVESTTSTATSDPVSATFTAPSAPSDATPAAPPVDDLMAKFCKPKNTDSWICEVCMISNPADRDTCLACESPRPGATVSNEKKAEAPKTFSFGSSGGFKFGESNASTGASNSTSLSGFKFGNSTSKTDGKVGSGIFGQLLPPGTDKAMPNSEKKDSPEEPAAMTFGSAGGFKFASTSEKVDGGFSFGNNAEGISPTLGFSFANKTSNDAEKGSKGSIFENAPKSKPAAEVFKATPKNSEKTASDSAATPRSAKKREYLSSLKALNIQVTNWIKSHVDENPLLDLTPVFKDYEKHISELKNKCKEEVKQPPETVLSKTEKNVKPFSFGLQSTTTQLSKDDGSPTQNGNEESEKDDVDENDPVEESDSLYMKKCKLFYKKDDRFLERGLGHIHLKKTDEKKLQIVVRANTKLGNILLNIVMNDEIPLQKQGKNNLLLICVPNPPIDPKADPEPVSFLIRVKTEEDVDELKLKICDLMKPVTN